MRLVFIRHSKSIDDTNGVSQRDNSPLSDAGIQLATARAGDFAQLSPVTCYASSYARAQMTAELLFPKLGAITRHDIHEIKRPAMLDGGNHADAVHFWEVTHKMDKYDPDWTLDGYESFREVTTRAATFLEFLVQNHREDDTIAVVSHGGFIRHCIGVACKGEAYMPSDFFDLLFPMKVDNLAAIELTLGSGHPSWHVYN